MTFVNLRLVGLIAALLIAPFATANHPQNDSGRTVVFDHVTGNEWWVEVALGGADAGSVVKVEAMDTNGPWVTLTKRSWGPYAASFHIEPGHRVLFRASWSDGKQQTSCWFTHPAGAEQCSTAFDATFSGVRGNEWWVQAYVTAAGGTVATVDVRIGSSSTWQPLKKQSWGAWAASYHMPQGTVIELRATSTTGAVDAGHCYQWIPPSNADAASVACASTGFHATFSNVKGNEYWAEVVIKANAPVYGVFLIMDCDPNRDPADMTYRADWGKWTLGGTRIPSGTRVTFHAFGETGSMDSPQGYIWPHATPTTGCPAAPAWPKHGSFAEYALYNEVSGGGHSDNTRATLRLTYRVPPEPYAAYWEGVCTGTTTHINPDGTSTTRTWGGESPTSPPVMTRTPRVGFQVMPWNTPNLPSTMQTDFGQYCMADDAADWSVTATGTQTKTMRLLGADGKPRTMTVWHAQNDGPADNEDRVIEWETKVGLVLHWERSGRMSGMGHFGGDLVRTDAPV